MLLQVTDRQQVLGTTVQRSGCVAALMPPMELVRGAH
jgi:hypothetical protein